MKKLLVIAAITLTCAVAVAPHARAQSASFQYTNLPAGPLLPGDTFTISISIVFTAGGSIMNLNGLSYWMAQTGGAGSPFSITNRNQTGSIFNQMQSPGLITPQVMDPINRNPDGTTNSTDLGALSQDPVGSGTYFVANISFQVAPGTAPGDYTISNTTAMVPGVGGRISRMTTSGGMTFAIADSPFMVTVVPEPSTYALLGFGLLSAGVVAYRRRRVQA